MGMAFVTTLAPDEPFTTMELSINFFRLVWQALLKAEARVVNRGKNVGYVECSVADQDGKQVAKAGPRVLCCVAITRKCADREGDERGKAGRNHGSGAVRGWWLGAGVTAVEQERL